MVPSGGLLGAKVAPTGTQMGFGNLIKAGTVWTQWTEKKRKNTHTLKVISARASQYTLTSISTKDKAIWYQ